MSDQQPTGVVAQATQLWGRLSPRRRFGLMAAGVLTLALVGYMRWSGSSAGYEVLFSSLSAEEAGQITSELKSKGIPYRLTAGGTTIKVPSDRVHDVRIELATAGYPRGGGVGFEVFDEQSFGTTSFVEQINYRRAMQGELSRTISALSVVESARVHIATGRRSIFRKSDEPPSASVTLRMLRGRRLGSAQVRGIVHLVSSSIDGLEPERVVIIDERGNVLSGSEDAQVGMEARTRLEEALTSRVRKMIERVVGPGHVAVVVTADMDYRKVDQTEEIYDKDKIALRSEARTIEGAGAAQGGDVGGIAGARGNLPGTAAAKPAGNGKGAQRLSETRNYEVNRVMRRIAGPKAAVRRLHVALLVDHKRIKPDKPAAKEGDEADKEAEDEAEAPEPKLVPRTKEELEQIAAIAREAAGLDEARGDRLEVRTVPFHESEDGKEQPMVAAAKSPPSLLSNPLVLAGAGGGVVLLLLVAMFLRRKPRDADEQPKVVALPASLAEVERALSGDKTPALGTGEDQQPQEIRLHDRVVAAVRKDTEHAARVLSSWLAEAPPEQQSLEAAK